jgi:Sir2 family
MFTTPGGLYERACKRMGVHDGIKLFSWSYFDKCRDEVTAFFVDINKEAQRAKPGPAHQAVKGLNDCGRLLRHYTMNVDGLAAQVSFSYDSLRYRACAAAFQPVFTWQFWCMPMPSVHLRTSTAPPGPRLQCDVPLTG